MKYTLGYYTRRLTFHAFPRLCGRWSLQYKDVVKQIYPRVLVIIDVAELTKTAPY